MAAVPGQPAGRSRQSRLLGHVQHPEAYSETLIESRGVPIALSVWDAPQRDVAVVFVPGTAAHPLFYEEFLDALWQAGCAVVGVHPQSHGKSPRVRRTLRWADVVADSADACRWARERFRCPVVLIGSSQGALVALLAAATGAPVAGVIAHNVFDPQDPAVLAVTRFGRAGPAQQVLRGVLAAAAAVAPRLPVPVTAYLDPERVFTTAWTRELYELDPLSLRTYPLGFLNDLVHADTSALYDGRLGVPVVVLASRGDPLFPLAGIRDLAGRLVAPSVRLEVLDSDCHLVLNEALDLAVPAVLAALAQMAPGSTTQDRAGA